MSDSLMDLPQNYLPVLPCPYKMVKGYNAVPIKRRELFVECGIHQNVNVDVNPETESVRFLPQKGQVVIEDLSSVLHVLPLFEYPLEEEWVTHDRILGFSNYKDTVTNMKTAARRLNLARNEIKSKEPLRQKIQKCIKATQDIMSSNAKYKEYLNILDEELPSDTHFLYERISDIGSAYNSDCLCGFNREFYGGLLSQIDSFNESSEILVHIQGPMNNTISVSTVSCDTQSGLKRARTFCSRQQDSMYQVCTSTLSKEKALICTRQKNSFVLLHLNDSFQLTEVGDVKIPSGVACSTCFSPYTENEILLSGTGKSVYLWDIHRAKSDKMVKCNKNDLNRLRPADDLPNTNRWSVSYFGGHPRHIAVADVMSLNLFDHRSKFKSGLPLFTLPSNYTKPEEHVMAACSLRFPYHGVATDYSLFLLDSRFPGTHVFNISTEFMSPPQYMNTLQVPEGSIEQLILLGSQQPAEVMCYPIVIRNGCTPTSSVLPWKASTIKSSMANVDSLAKRFDNSLAGMAVSPISPKGSFTIYQLDSCGDIFYQTYECKHLPLFSNKLSPGDDGSKHCNSRSCFESFKSSTSSLKSAAGARVEKWLAKLNSQLKAAEMKRTAKHEHSFEEFEPDQSLVSDIFNTTASTQDILEMDQCNNCQQVVNPDRPHQSLRSFNSLPCKAHQSALLLSLKNGDDISDILVKRELWIKRRLRIPRKTLSQRKKPKYVEVDVTSSDTDTEMVRELSPPLFSSSSEDDDPILNMPGTLEDNNQEEEKDHRFVTQATTSSSSYLDADKNQTVLDWLNNRKFFNDSTNKITLTELAQNCVKNPTELASICSSRRSSTLSRPEMRKFAHPALSGFLQSPLKKKIKSEPQKDL